MLMHRQSSKWTREGYQGAHLPEGKVNTTWSGGSLYSSHVGQLVDQGMLYTLHVLLFYKIVDMN
uniref:Uncharacterized protein n=1 Tax=Anguilla anguilla TaxID=7936 RepID=A0A0E9X8G7_ANGAN